MQEKVDGLTRTMLVVWKMLVCLRRGLADLKVGRVEDANEVLAELDAEFGDDGNDEQV